MNPLQTLYDNAMTAKKDGDYHNAFNILQQLVQMSSEEPVFRSELSWLANHMAKPMDKLRELACFHAAEAARIQPDVVRNWIALGEICVNSNKFIEGIAAYEKALQMDDQNANVWGIMGFAYARLNKRHDMMRCYRRALEINPDLGDVHFLLSCASMAEDWNPHELAFHGERGFTSAKKTPYAVESCWHATLGYLAIGDYEKGWFYNEARLRRSTMNEGVPLPQERYNKPLWMTVDDKKVTVEGNCRVLVQHEMGLGDAFLFMRFLPLIKRKFDLQVIFECLPSIVDLAQQNFPDIQVVPFGTVDENDFDYQVGIMSLPLALGIKNNSVPWSGPYIKADPEKVKQWAEKFGSHELSHEEKRKFLNVGICWAGGARAHNSSNYNTDKRRSLSFEQIKPILKTPDVNFISLQQDSHEMTNIGLKDFSDTAAVIELLDVVVTVDTSVANLAGAMGKLTLLMNRFDSCWRWSEYLSTPWFPNTIDIRQEKSGEWDSVIQRVITHLKDIKKN